MNLLRVPQYYPSPVQFPVRRSVGSHHDHISSSLSIFCVVLISFLAGSCPLSHQFFGEISSTCGFRRAMSVQKVSSASSRIAIPDPPRPTDFYQPFHGPQPSLLCIHHSVFYSPGSSQLVQPLVTVSLVLYIFSAPCHFSLFLMDGHPGCPKLSPLGGPFSPLSSAVT